MILLLMQAERVRDQIPDALFFVLFFAALSVGVFVIQVLKHNRRTP